MKLLLLTHIYRIPYCIYLANESLIIHSSKFSSKDLHYVSYTLIQNRLRNFCLCQFNWDGILYSQPYVPWIGFSITRECKMLDGIFSYSLMWAWLHCIRALQWRHNGRDGVSNHQPPIVYSIMYSGADQINHQSSASLTFVLGIHRWPGNSTHKRPITRKCFKFEIWNRKFDDVIMKPLDRYTASFIED